MDEAQSKAPVRSLVSIDDVGGVLYIDISTAAITSSTERERRAPARRSAVVQGDQLGDAGGPLPAFDLDHEMIVHP
jgi:hypothetical protein